LLLLGESEKMFIPRLDKYSYPTNEDYQHFHDCEIRMQGKLDECKRCKYVWNHWYGTVFPYDSNSSYNEKTKKNRKKGVKSDQK
jgi:hypothetical protein